MADVVDHRQHLGRVIESGHRGRLGEAREVIRKPHEPHRVGDRGVGREIPDPRAREGECFTHGAGDNEAFAAGKQRER